MSRATIGYRSLVWSPIGGPQRAINRSGVTLLTAMNCRFSRLSLNQPGAAISARTPTIPATHAAAISSLFFITRLPRVDTSIIAPQVSSRSDFLRINARESLGLWNRVLRDALYFVRQSCL